MVPWRAQRTEAVARTPPYSVCTDRCPRECEGPLEQARPVSGLDARPQARGRTGTVIGSRAGTSGVGRKSPFRVTFRQRTLRHPRESFLRRHLGIFRSLVHTPLRCGMETMP